MIFLRQKRNNKQKQPDADQNIPRARALESYKPPDPSTLHPINQAQSIQQPSPKRTVKSYLKNFTSMFTPPRKTFHNFKTGARKTFNLVPPQTKPKQPGADPGSYKTIKH